MDPDLIPEDFDPVAYLDLNPDVAASRINAFDHYRTFGREEGRIYKYVAGKHSDLDKTFHDNPDTQRPSNIGHEHIWSWLSRHFNQQGLKVLEVGSRAVSSQALWRKAIPDVDYTGFDFHSGENVDVVGDAHYLSSFFDESYFDLVISFAVFEHLAAPWLVAEEIAKVLKVGGTVLVESHFSFNEHELPWHFFQFNSRGLEVLFPAELGFETIDLGLSSPIVGRFSAEAAPYLRGQPIKNLFCHSSFAGRKLRHVSDSNNSKSLWQDVAQRISSVSSYPLSANSRIDSDARKGGVKKTRIESVVIHAGLHKSATTTLQSAWSQGLDRNSDWTYPRPLSHGPGHAAIAWWLRNLPHCPHQPFTEVVTEAQESGKSHILISAEDLDQCTSSEFAVLKNCLPDAEFSLLLTASPATTRWLSTWQELVKHGLSLPQAESVDLVDHDALLTPSSLASLVDQDLFTRVMIRLVRTEPPEPLLVRDVSNLIGFPVLEPVGISPQNVSFSNFEIRLLQQWNLLTGLPGMHSAEGRAFVNSIRESLGWDSALNQAPVQIDLDVYDHVADLARNEQAFLRSLYVTRFATVEDPHSLLGVWDQIPANRSLRKD